MTPARWPSLSGDGRYLAFVSTAALTGGAVGIAGSGRRALTQVFVFNYLVSLVSLGTVVGLAAMLGLAMGLTIGRGPQFLLAIPLAA